MPVNLFAQRLTVWKPYRTIVFDTCCQLLFEGGEEFADKIQCVVALRAHGDEQRQMPLYVGQLIVEVISVSLGQVIDNLRSMEGLQLPLREILLIQERIYHRQ